MDKMAFLDYASQEHYSKYNHFSELRDDTLIF